MRIAFRFSTIGSKTRKRIERESGVIRKIEELFGIDLRSLAVFRIGLALVLLVDQINRSAELGTFYTDDGLLPRTLLLQQFQYPSRLSLHLMNGSALFEIILFLIAETLAVALLFGWRTRLVTFLSWFFLMSMHVRNPMVLHSGDYLLRMLLFWSMFLPLGARYSVDSALNSSKKELPGRILSMGTVALWGQVILVYGFASFSKWGDPAWQEGRAVSQALSTAQYANPLSLTFLHFPAVLKFLNYVVLFFETLGPLLLFIPVFTGPIRTVTIVGFFCLQLGFGLGLVLGNFPWVASVAMLPFVPSWVWEKISERLGIPQTDLGYSPPTLGRSRFANFFAFFLFIYVVFLNVSEYSRVRMPQSLSWIGEALYFDQTWSMFVPPDQSSSWFVIPGKKKDGTQVDLFKGEGVVSWEKPALASALYKNMYWIKYMGFLWSSRYSAQLPYYGWYLCRNWNERHQGNQQIKELEIYGMYQNFYPKLEKPEKVYFWTHRCFAAGEPEDLSEDTSHVQSQYQTLI